MHIHSILVVCTGNICRSPMAQALLSAALPGVAVHSAGVAALAGHAAELEAIQLLAELGLDLGAHRARQLTQPMVEQASLVLVAEQRHRRHIEQRYPFARGRVYRIAEQSAQDVPDPYRQHLGHYRHTLDILQKSVQHWVQRLQPVNPAQSLL